MGAAPFLTWVADRTSPDRALALEGVDIDPQALLYARYNVGQALGRRNNVQDSFSLRAGDWHASLAARSYDYIYFNPPFLPTGEVVREDYCQTPASSMYVAGSVDGLEHYRQFLPHLKDALSPQGRLVVRVPREGDRATQVHKIVRDVLGDDATVHSVEVESEVGDRSGKGIVVDKTKTEAVRFRFGLIRTVGLGVIHEEVAA